MSTIVFLALIRLVLCLAVVFYAIRGRYWLLTGVLVIASVVSVATVVGLSRAFAGALAVPVYALLAAHTLDVTRRHHQ